MRGKNTAIILGAGSSACYEDGVCRIPAQDDILNSLVYPKISTSSGYGAPTFVNTHGMTHSYPLAQYLHIKFNIPQKDGGEATTFWEELVKTRNLSLESLYDELEIDKSEDGHYACQDFKAILRTKIANAPGDRSSEKVCKYHRKLIKALEPGDYIIDFNWDTVADDALLYESPYWFPITGYGVPAFGWQGEFNNKHFPVKSLIELYHIHGSVALYEPLDPSLRDKYKKLMVIGPRGYSTINVLTDLMGITPEKIAEARKSGKQPTPKRKTTEQEDVFVELGYLWIPDKNIWLQPIFIPPSKTKPEYKNWYASLLRKKIHSRIPFTEQFIIAGYSFPPADFDHLRHFFITEIIPEDTRFICINLENNNENYRKRVRTLFPKWNIDFSIFDFKQFCNSI
ncbi:MAG TPA: hypothetical protein VMW81_09985 [Nitrospinota bacterium]|nr:hypothetical protein [Nitrospinota bacterium]